jgi:hypothetical protein
MLDVGCFAPFFAISLGFLLLVSSSSAATNFFPIMPWNHAPNDPAVLKRIKDCGFTVAGFVAPGTLDACEKAGLKAIVSDARTSSYDWANVDAAKAQENVKGLIAEVGKHPAIFGYYLRDEPTAWWFPNLEKVASQVRELAPDKWAYINLFPDYADNGQLGTSGYAEYLEKFIATCHPRIISYDNYSLMDGGSVRNNFWSNLESVRDACQKHNIEFWNIVLSVAHFNYAEPTAAGFRLQAYCTLACGGRGLSWFTYFAPPVGGYRGAPVDQFGNETPTWHMMQNVNLQVLKLAPTLLQLKCDDAYHIGTVPAGCHGPATNSLVSTIEGGNVLVGDFTHTDGSRYVMVVNKSLTGSRPCWPQFRKSPKSLKHISPYSGAVTPYEGEYVWLAPGQGVLLKPEW